MIQFQISTLLAPFVYLFIFKFDFVYSSTKNPRLGPAVLQSHVDDEDFIVSSGYDWNGSGSGEIDLDRFRGGADEEHEEAPTIKTPILKVTTPDSSRIFCVVCSGDASCRDPYIRNVSHIQPCQSSGEGCLKVVTPSGDTYRNCQYGIFEKAEKTAGCHVIKEDHVGHKFVLNATICICHTNECNGYFVGNGLASGLSPKPSGKSPYSGDLSFSRNTPTAVSPTGQKLKTSVINQSKIATTGDLSSTHSSSTTYSTISDSPSRASNKIKSLGLANLLAGIVCLLLC